MTISALVAASLLQFTPLAGLVPVAISGSSPELQRPAPTLDTATPFRLEVSSPGTPRQVMIHGTDFENTGHPDRDHYMHWQIRRDDGTWQPCAKWNNRSGAICQNVGWRFDTEVIEIGDSYLAREGFIELRLFRDLADPTETDPRKSASFTTWSNILRIPVVVPGPAPRINALSRTSFPIAGTSGDYRFIIDAAGLDGPPVVVFRGDVVVWPERVYDGHRIEVTVPEVYRRDTPGELPLSVRTDKGGPSREVYITFVQPTTMVIGRVPNGLTSPKAATPSSVLPRAGIMIPASSEACMPGYVWREATPDDHVCVTSDTRSRAARQNAEAPARRTPNGGSTPAPCVPGYVWREAVAGDVVCVTPAERAQAAEDNRLGPSRVARRR